MAASTEENSLFANSDYSHQPLAARMRPRNLDEYIGQEHIVGKGRLLRRAIQADQLTSVIFYGPPGSGKTTLARVIAHHTSSNFLTLNAVLTGVADIRKAIETAENQRTLYSKKTILFVDEVHRWNKSQQDALLPWVENGTIILIGATTENPFFEVNKALVSRSRVFQLKPLTKDDLINAANQALTDTERGYGHWNVQFEKGALEHLVETANGDARSLLNALELAVETTPEKWNPNASKPEPSWGSTIFISKEACEESIQKKVVLYDRDGDYHYDIISAFIKSLRGRDPDAACYWLARMVKAGEDPSFIFRRMLISACEDTGLADPHAISVVESCAQAFDRVGLPEGRYFLAHAALYLATAPKSNSSMAFFDALSAVEKEDAEVPNHLRDASRDAEGFGHGKGYLYPHAYRDHWVSQQYLPDSLVGKVFYTPTTQGYENTIRQDVLSRRELQIASLLEKENNSSGADMSMFLKSGHFMGFEKTEENLTFSPENKQSQSFYNNAEKQWRDRLDSNKAQVLLFIRNKMTEEASILRHHRCLIWNADDALLVFEVNRKCPEGLTAALCRTQKGMEILKQYSSTLNELERPVFSFMPKERNSLEKDTFVIGTRNFGQVEFDRIFLRDIILEEKDINALSQALYTAWNGEESAQRNIAFDEDTTAPQDLEKVFTESAKVILSQKIYNSAQRLSSLIRNQVFAKTTAIPEDVEEILTKMEEAENLFYNDQSNPLFSWDENKIIQNISSKKLQVSVSTEEIEEKRKLSPQEIQRWFNPDSSYGSFMAKYLSEVQITQIMQLLLTHCQHNSFTWISKNSFFTISK